MESANIVATLQTAIGPTILISGVGLILLTITNRLGRTIDRARALASRNPDEVRGQLSILWKRARIQRASVFFASLTALSAAGLIIAIFLSTLLELSVGACEIGFFFTAMVSLIFSLVLFLHDINLTLEALRMELKSAGHRP